MKSFIVAAMLVAAVAGQSFDMFKYGQEKSLLLNKQYGQNELLLKKLGYPVDKSLVYGQKDLVDLPFYLQNEKIFTIEELYTTQLFKEYLTLPLFRQFITYPAFQKYVQSIYFQKFWTVPEFKQYFVQPELFYKFVLPQIQLFTTNTFEQQIVNKNVLPFVADYEREFVPTTYNKDYLLQDGLFYKNLLNKLYNQIYNVDETTTVKKIVDPITGEIKMIPFGIKGIEGIDTIFGDKLVKDVLLKKFLINKNVDIDSIFGDKLIFDLLLKKNVDFDLIKKIILTGNVELLDTIVFGDYKDLLLKKNVDVELLKDLLIKKNVDFDLIKKIILTKMILGDNMNMYTNTMIPEEYLKEKMMYNTPIYNRMMYNKRFPVETFEGKMNLFDLLHKQEGLIVDPVEKMNVFDILSKKDLIVKDKILLNKILADKINEIDNFGTYETVVPKMYNDVTKFERIPLTLEGVKPMMGVRTFEDKKMIPELIKA